MSTSMRALRQCTRVATRAPLTTSLRTSPLFSRSLLRPLPIAARCMSTTASEGESAKADAPAPASDGHEAKLKAKDEEIADLTSRLRYAQADLINQQRIAAREKEQQRDFAISRFASDLLETADVLAIALRSLSLQPPANAPSDPAAAAAAAESLRSGIEMTQKQLTSTFAKYGVTPFDPTGEVFDPNRHEALYEAPAPPGKEPGTVIDCQKIGYMLKDRTLRAAQVGVARS